MEAVTLLQDWNGHKKGETLTTADRPAYVLANLVSFGYAHPAPAEPEGETDREPDLTWTVNEIRDELKARDITVPSDSTRKAELLKLFKD